MNSNPDPSPIAPVPEITYTSFINDLMNKSWAWGHSGRMERALATMMGGFLGWLREKMDVWMAQMEAGQPMSRPRAKRVVESEDTTETEEQEPKPKPARKPKVDPWLLPSEADVRAAAELASKLAHEGDEIWRRKPQWSLYFTWPFLRPAGTPVSRRKFNWMYGYVQHEAGYFHGQLTLLVQTAPMMRLFGCCPAAVRVWSPICWMFGVNSNLIRFPGQIPPKRPRKPRQKLTRDEKWWRARARDHSPEFRDKYKPDPDHPGHMMTVMEIRPKGSYWRETSPRPPYPKKA